MLGQRAIKRAVARIADSALSLGGVDGDVDLLELIVPALGDEAFGLGLAV